MIATEIVNLEDVRTETSVHLVAKNPTEMAQAKEGLKAWLTAKVKQCQSESNELFDAAEHARQQHWSPKVLLRHANLAKKRTEFYERALAAVEAGYTLVPNFPVDLFAVRVKRLTPRRSQYADSSMYKSFGHSPRKDTEPETLPAGEGRYVDAGTMIGITGDHTVKDSQGKDIKKYFFNPTDFAEVVFPIEAAHIDVMSATSEAMALKVFDAIGICPQTGKGDPLIIGKILGPKVGYNRKEMSFLISWYLDLRTL